MADQLAAGPALDAATCQALHLALLAAGKPELAREWEPQRASYEIGSGGEIPLGVIYTAISRDGNVMLLALEHMRELGHWVQIYSAPGEKWECWIGTDANSWFHNGCADTAPEAVARAVVAALGGDSEC